MVLICSLVLKQSNYLKREENIAVLKMFKFNSMVVQEGTTVCTCQAKYYVILPFYIKTLITPGGYLE